MEGRAGANTRAVHSHCELSWTLLTTGTCCISYVYSPLASSRLACQDIQLIQHIQHIQPYSHTRHTSYSAIQPPSASQLASEVANARSGAQPSGSYVLTASLHPKSFSIAEAADSVLTVRVGGLRPASRVPRQRLRLMRLLNLTKLHVHPCHKGA